MFTPGKFRHRALQRMSSPEQLDQMLRVALPRRWVALAALLLLVVAAIVWSSVANVPTSFRGPGYLLPQGGLREIDAPVGGSVESISIDDGQHVVAGQELGRIRDGAGRTTVIRAPETGVITETDAVRNAFVSAGVRIGLVQPVGYPLVVYAYVQTDTAAGLRPGTQARVRFGAGIGQRYGYAVGTVSTVSQFSETQQRLNFILQDSSVVDDIRKLGPANEVVILLKQSARTPNGLTWGSGSGPPGILPAGLPSKVTFVVGSHHPIDNVF